MTQEKIILTPETFKNVEMMLASPDEENAIVALSALEGMDFKNCTMYMTLLYKESKSKAALWKEHCPSVVKNIQNLGLDDPMTLRDIYLKLKDRVSADEMKVYLSIFSRMSMVMLQNWGFEGVVDDFNMNLTLKKDDK